MNTKHAAWLLMAVLSGPAIGARAVGIEAFRAELENALTAGFAESWCKKRQAERTEEIGRADAFVRQAERLFGTAMNRPSSVCRAAAITRKAYLMGLNDMAVVSEGRPVRRPSDLLAPMVQAVDFGQDAARCLDYLDAAGPAQAPAHQR